MKRILIGGSGSTGSSLLTSLLSKHPIIFAGEETNLFCKKALFTNFKKNKSSILKSGLLGLTNNGFHLYRKTDLISKKYRQDSNSIQSLLSESSDFQEFADNFFLRGMQQEQKSHWLEKTPSNSYNYKYFLNGFENAYVIHIVRNPLDTIASLINRGFNTSYALGIYFLNNAVGFKVENDNHVLKVKYEDLVANPNEELKRILSFLDLGFNSAMLSMKSKKELNIGSWNLDVNGVIKSNNNTFDNLSQKKKEMILTAINAFKLTTEGKAYYKIDENSAFDIIERLGYSLKPDIKMNQDIFKKLRSENKKNKAIRLKKLYLKSYFNFPMEYKNFT